MLADVRLHKINCFSDLPDYKQGDLTSELGVHTHTHTRAHTHVLQFLETSRARNDSHPSPLILIHARATIIIQI